MKGPLHRIASVALAALCLATAPAVALAATPASAATPAAGVHAATFTGLGFDVCSTPAESTMTKWLASPYRAIGVYIGGVNRACSQPNLTSGWVSTETAAGWGIIAIYVGLQAPVNACGCASISASQAGPEGTSAAQDAVKQAQAVAIGSGNPIYFDMEGYNTGSTNTPAVMTFLAAWTSELHTLGYVSGVYSSAGSGITDLVARYGTSFVEPDDIWIADWNGQQTVSDPAVPAADWANHQRLHQFNGGQNLTYGGVTLNVDGDYCDGAVVSGGSGTPGAPTGVKAKAGNRSALVSWTAPAGSVTGYQVRSSPGNHLTVVDASMTSVVATGLANGTAYTFKVVAVSGSKTGPASAPSAAVTPTKMTTVPSQPGNVKATASSGSASVTWTAPARNGGSPITAYYVTSYPGGYTVAVGGTTLVAKVSGLTNGTTYTFKVTALSALGSGAPSLASNAVIP